MHSYDLCEVLGEIGVECPVPSGVRNATWELRVPRFVQVRAVTGEGDVLVCVQEARVS